MVDGLSDYVKAQLQQGYSKEQIRSTLLRSGYSVDAINAALISPNRKKFVVITIFAVFFALAAAVVFLVQSEEELAVSDVTGTLTVDTPTARSGEPLYFTLRISMVSARVRYAIVDAEKREVASKEETISSSAVRDSIVLSHSLARGSYALVAQIADVSLAAPFEITEKGSLFRLVNTPIPEEARIQNISEIAQQSPEIAQSLCAEFVDQTLADQCFVDAALAAENAVLCGHIIHYQPRDSCYFNLVFVKHELSLCERIENPDLRFTCGNV